MTGSDYIRVMNSRAVTGLGNIRCFNVFIIVVVLDNSLFSPSVAGALTGCLILMDEMLLHVVEVFI